MKIFLSYSRAQVAIARSVAAALRAAGHIVFFDEETLVPGAEYHNRIREAIFSTDLFIFLASEDSVADGAYARAELEIAAERWPNPSGRILPVLVTKMSFKLLPPYLRAITVLRPEGNLEAGIVGAINKLAQTRRRPKLFAGFVIVGILAGIAETKGGFFSSNEGKAESTTIEPAMSQPEAAAMQWLASQNIPSWVFDPGARVYAKISMMESPSFNESPDLAKDSTWAMLKVYQPEVWSLMTNLHVNAVGPVVINAKDDFLVAIFLDCHASDPGLALTAAGVESTPVNTGKSLYYNFKTLSADSTLTTALVTIGPLNALRDADVQWKYPRVLIFGSEKSVERALERQLAATVPLPPTLVSAAEVAGNENWLAFRDEVAKREDAGTIDTLGLALPTAAVVWSHNFNLEKLREMNKSTPTFPEVSFGARLTYGEAAIAENTAQALRQKIVSSAQFEDLDCGAATLVVMQPGLIPLVQSAAEAIKVSASGTNVNVSFETKRMKLDNPSVGRSIMKFINWAAQCASTRAKEPLVKMDATLQSAVEADITREGFQTTIDKALREQIGHVSNPTNVLGPSIIAYGADPIVSKRIYNYMQGCTNHPQQLVDWVRHGLLPIFLLELKTDPSGAKKINGRLFFGSIVMGLAAPGNVEFLINDLATTRDEVPFADTALMSVMCNEALPMSEILWDTVIARISKGDLTGTSAATAIAGALADCIANDPIVNIPNGLAQLWPTLPMWARTGIAGQLKAHATADEAFAQKYAIAVNSLPPGSLRVSLVR